MVPRPVVVRRLAACCALVALLCASCSGKLVTVRGKVLYKGEPVPGAVVTFHPKADDPKALRPSGLTDKDGVYTLTTGASDGAPPGEYVVTVNWYKPVEAAAEKKKVMSTETPPSPPDFFLGKSYATRDKSQLTATVAGGTNEIEPFRLD